MFIPDLYFLPIADLGSRGQKGTRSPESESATLCISKFLNQICNCACTAAGYWCSTCGTACCMYISRTMNCLASGGSSLKKRIQKYHYEKKNTKISLNRLLLVPIILIKKIGHCRSTKCLEIL